MSQFDLSDAELQSLANQMDAVLTTSAASYGVSGAQATTFNGASSDFGVALVDVTAKKAALASSVQAKDTDRGELLDNISLIANIVYNNPAVTPAMIAALGLAPRSTTRTLHQPKTPENLLATPYASGNVLLKWSRGENVYGAVYVIEAKGETGDWEQVWSTTKTRVTLTDYTPGVPMWFRIRATRNNQISTPSNESPIYHAGSSMSLSLAA
jgi:hypothetical protein